MTGRRTIAAVTGSRADYGLMRPVMRAIRDHDDLELKTVVAGAHLLGPQETIREVAEEFEPAVTIQMQSAGVSGRVADAEALGRGVSGLATWLGAAAPDVVLVLGDRIEAMAAAAAGCVAGVRVAHLHGGDRAEGIADEALRHAITKLAHIHLPATTDAAERIIAMGEEPLRTHLVGSPAIDGLQEIPPLSDAEHASMGAPAIVVLLHPSGLSEDDEWANAMRLLRLCMRHGPMLVLEPNHDPGREGIMQAIEEVACPRRAHLRREQFIGLLRRGPVLVGNSSAGLIEGAAIGVGCINVGTRQAGRLMPANVVDVPDWDFGAIEMALEEQLVEPRGSGNHPYGDGRAGPRTAEVLATFDAGHHGLRKLNTY